MLYEDKFGNIRSLEEVDDLFVWEVIEYDIHVIDKEERNW